MCTGEHVCICVLVLNNLNIIFVLFNYFSSAALAVNSRDVHFFRNFSSQIFFSYLHRLRENFPKTFTMTTFI